MLEGDRVAIPSTRSEKLRTAPGDPIASRRWFKRSQRILGRDWPEGYLFIALTLVLLGLVKAYPFLQALWFSFHRVIGFRMGDFVWLDNYVLLWGDDRFVRAVQVTLTFTFFSEMFKIGLGLAAALLLHNLPRWGSVLGGLLLVPYVIPEVVRALAWRLLLDPLFGAGNCLLVNVLHVMSVGQPWLSDPRTALPSVIMVSVWAGTPFIVVLLLAGLKGIDAELYDAASVDGANGWRRFLHITLPGLRDVLIVATLLSTIATFNGFTLTYLLTSGGPAGATRVYSILAYEYGVSAQRTSTGIAVAMTAAPILLVLTLVLGRYMPRRDDPVHSVMRGGAVSRVFRALGWPVVALVRELVGLLGLLNDGAERLVGLIGRGLLALGRPLGLDVTPSRTAQRRIAGTIMYVLIGAILVFELLPVYFVVITAFKSELQVQQVARHVLAGPVDAGGVPLPVHKDSVRGVVPQHGAGGLDEHGDRGAGGEHGGVRTGPAALARCEHARLVDPGGEPYARRVDADPDVPDPGAASADQHALGAAADLPDVRAAVRDLAADGLLPLDPGGARERGDDRRL
jgi:multiple sugar transport system permease protein